MALTGIPPGWTGSADYGMWVAFDPDGGACLRIVDDSKQETIHRFLAGMAWAHPWRYYYNRGYRALKCDVTCVVVTSEGSD